MVRKIGVFDKHHRRIPIGVVFRDLTQIILWESDPARTRKSRSSEIRQNPTRDSFGNGNESGAAGVKEAVSSDA
jgi:hypothetical protein